MIEPYLCKVFKNGEWEVLGVIHAEDAEQAFEIAIEKWEDVTCVYCLYAVD